MLSVASLEEARRLFETLGFQVAPNAEHPFGTGNACVFFEDGTYIEPLAVIDRELAESSASDGNAFVRHELAFRLRHTSPGFTGFALKSANAEDDHRRFQADGIDGGPILSFQRPLKLQNGRETELGFRLAFATNKRSPTLLAFSCQRLVDMPLDRGSLTAHPNGVRGIARLVFADPEPEEARRLFQAVLDVDDVLSNSLGVSITSAGRTFEILGPEGLAVRYGGAVASERGTRFFGCVLAISQLSDLGERALAHGLESRQALGRLIIPISEDGVFLAFEEPS